MIIVALVWFCGRKAARRRKRGSRTPLMSRDSSLKTKSTMSEKVTAFLGQKGSDAPAAGRAQRSTTPALERGMREETQNAPRTRESRSSSAPAVSFRERALGALVGRKPTGDEDIQEGPPRIPTPVPADHRKSASVSSFIQSWSATDENNNPFRDPETREPLRLVNADISRSNTNRTVRPPPAAVTTSPLRANNPFSSPLDTPLSPPPIGPLPSRPTHKRSFSQSRIDPFLDPSLEEQSRSGTPDELVRRDNSMSSRHSRTRSTVSARVSRGLSQTVRSPLLQHQLSGASASSTIESGFVSAISPRL